MIERKGITPVVAAVSILLITVASGGGLYIFMQNQQNSAETDLGIQTSSLSVLSCKNQGSSAVLTVKNSGDEAGDLSKVSVRFGGEVRDKTVEPQTLSPGETGTIELEGTYLKSRSGGTLIRGSTEEDFACEVQEQDKPPSPTEESFPAPT